MSSEDAQSSGQQPNAASYDSDDFLTALDAGADLRDHPSDATDGVFVDKNVEDGSAVLVDFAEDDGLKQEVETSGATEQDTNEPSTTTTEFSGTTDEENASRKRKRSSSILVASSSNEAEDSQADEKKVRPEEGGLDFHRRDAYQDAEAYDPIKFGDIGTYMKHKRQKLKVQENDLLEQEKTLQAIQRSHNGEAGADDGAGRDFEADYPPVFKGCCIYINGLTTPPFSELRRLIVLHGGDFMAYLDVKGPVTHIVASSLTPKKRVEFKDYKVVNERWVLDSINNGRRMDWRMYRVEADAMLSLERYQSMKVEREQTAKNRGSQWASSLRRAGPGSNEQAGPSTPSKNYSAGSSAPLPPVALGDKNNTSPWGKGVAQRKLFDMMQDLPKKSPEKKEEPIRDDKEQYEVGRDPSSKQAEALVPWPTRVESADGCPSKERQAPFHGYSSRPSNAHAARLLASPSWREQNTASSADFLSGYFAKSRLHHLSMWKMQMRDMVEEALREAGRELGSKDLPRDVKRVIMHVDFDSFFVSVGLRDKPELLDKPVVVCHARGQIEVPKGQENVQQSSTSEIASCNYVARTYGVKNGMSLGQAKVKCPNVIAIPYNFKAYDEIAIDFYTILIEHADAIEAVSVDEALIDVSFLMEDMRKGKRKEGKIYEKYQNYLSTQGDAWSVERQFAEALRDEIREKTRTEASIGIGSNVLLARLATRKAKPGGSFHLSDESVTSFLSELDIDDLHGIGWATREKCKREFNCYSIPDLLAKTNEASFKAIFGPKEGATYWAKLHGKDREKLVGGAVRNSIGAAVNYAMRFKEQSEVETFVDNLSKEVTGRMEKSKCVGRKVWVHVMVRSKDAPVEAPKFLGHGVCDNFHKSVSLSRATRDASVIRQNAWSLISSINADPKELRGIGIGMETLSKTDDKGKILASKPVAGQTMLKFATKVAIETHPPKVAEAPTIQTKAVRFQDQQATHIQEKLISEDETSSEDEVTLQPGSSRAMVVCRRSVSPPIPRADETAKFADESKIDAVAPTQYAVPTQIASDVLLELPATMQQKIQEARDRKRVARAPSEDITSRPTTTHPLNITASQLDESVMNELPESIRKEILRDIAISTHRTRLLNEESPKPKRTRAATESPKKSSRTSPAKVSKSKLARDQTILDKATVQVMNPGVLNDQELIDLGADPEYFRGLPLEFQRELLRELTSAKRSRQARSLQSTHTEDMTRAERRAAEAARLAEAKALVGRPAVPFLQAIVPSATDSQDPFPMPPTLKGASTTEEVRAFLTKWFEAHKEYGPREGDVARVLHFLRETVAPRDERVSPDLEKAEALLTWLKHLLSHAPWQATGTDAKQGLTKAAEKWWAAFSILRDSVNQIVTQSFGAPLNL